MSGPWGFFFADSFEISERREGTRWTFLIKCCTSGTLSLPSPLWILQTSALCKALSSSLFCLILYHLLKMVVSIPVQIPELQFFVAKCFFFFIYKHGFLLGRYFLLYLGAASITLLPFHTLISSKHLLALLQTSCIMTWLLDCKTEMPCLSRIVFY